MSLDVFFQMTLPWWAQFIINVAAVVTGLFVFSLIDWAFDNLKHQWGF
jgi:hypothetical protein